MCGEKKCVSVSLSVVLLFLVLDCARVVAGICVALRAIMFSVLLSWPDHSGGGGRQTRAEARHCVVLFATPLYPSLPVCFQTNRQTKTDILTKKVPDNDLIFIISTNVLTREEKEANVFTPTRTRVCRCTYTCVFH